MGDPDGHCPICLIPVAVVAVEEVAESPEGQEIMEEGSEAAEAAMERYGPMIEQGASNGWNALKGLAAAGAAYLSSPKGGEGSGQKTGNVQTEQKKSTEPPKTSTDGASRKGGGRNAQKDNQARKDSAQTNLDKAKKDLSAAKQQPPSKQRSEAIQKAQQQIKHWQGKVAEKSETHSRKKKGN
jgi:hypothetical protein